MKERRACNGGSHTLSNYVVVPGQCPRCSLFSSNDTSNLGPYRCDSGSTASAAWSAAYRHGQANYKSDPEKEKGLQFDSCDKYVDREKEEKKEAEKRDRERQKLQQEEIYRQRRKQEEEEANRQRRQAEREEAYRQRVYAEKEADNQRKREKEAYEATYSQRKMKFEELLMETRTYERKNNLICVNICLPKKNNEEYMKKDILFFLNSFNKIDKFVNGDDYGLGFRIQLPKKAMENIIESKKMQNYFLDNKKNDMFAFKNKDVYVVLFPETISKIAYEGYEDNENIIVDLTPYSIWLKREELPNFLGSYNKLINKYR